MKHILLLGATGKTGRMLTSMALEAGLFVTVLVKNAACVKLQHDLLEVVEGDVLNYADVEKSVQGQDAVLSTLGSDGKNSEVLTTGTKNIISAMEKEKVHRFIGISSIGAGSTKDKMGFLFMLKLELAGLRDSFRAKAEQEKLLHRSHLDFTLIQAAALTNNKQRSISQVKSLATEKLNKQILLGPGRISRMQVAAFILNELLHPAWIGKSICIYN